MAWLCCILLYTDWDNDLLIFFFLSSKAFIKLMLYLLLCCIRFFFILMEKQKLLIPFNYCQSITAPQKNLAWKGPLEVQPPVQHTAKLKIWSYCSRSCSMQFWKSLRTQVTYVVPLGNLFQCLTTTMVKHQDGCSSKRQHWKPVYIIPNT